MTHTLVSLAIVLSAALVACFAQWHPRIKIVKRACSVHFRHHESCIECFFWSADVRWGP